MKFEQETLAYDEIELNIPRMIKKCIENIKWIVLCALICALALTTLKYLKDMKTYKTSQEAVDSNSIELDDSEKTLVDRYLFMKEKELQLKENEDNPVIHSIDFNEAYCGEVQYYIEAESNVQTAVTSAIDIYIDSMTFKEDIKGYIDFMNPEYVLDTTDAFTSEDDKSVICVRVWASTNENCTQYISIVKDKIESYAENLKNSIGSHKIKELNSSITSGYANWVYINQNEYYAELATIENNLKSFYQSMTDNQKKYVDAKESELTKNMEPEVEKVASIKPGISVKWMVIGLFLGVFVAVCIIIVMMLFGGKLQSEEELGKRLEIDKLGCIDKNNEVKGLENKFKILTSNESLNEIYLLTTREEVPESLLQELKTKISGLNCNVITNVIKPDVKLDDLDKNSVAVLVEKIGASKVKEIYMEAKLCKMLGVDVKGYICIEG